VIGKKVIKIAKDGGMEKIEEKEIEEVFL